MSDQHNALPVHRQDRDIYVNGFHLCPARVNRTYDYINNFDSPVRVVFRGGLHLVLPPARNRDLPPGFYVIERMTLGDNVIGNVYGTLFGKAEHSPDWLVLRNQQVRREKSREGLNPPNNEWVRAAYTDPLAVLSSPGGVYLVAADIVISRVFNPNDLSEGPSHPIKRMAEESIAILGDEIDNCGMGLFIDYVDNTTLRGNYYTNINGRIFTLKGRTDISLDDGFYFAEKQRLKHTFVQCGEIKYINFDNAGKYQIYHTLEEARAHGNPDTYLNVQERFAREQMIIEKEKAIREKADAERELREAKVELARLQHAADMRAMERAERERVQQEEERWRQREQQREDRTQEQHYRRKEHERNETISLWKFAVVLVTVVGGLIAAIAKLVPSSK